MTAGTNLRSVADGASRLALAARRYAEDEARVSSDIPGCVHRSLIVDVMNDAHDIEGLDPLRLLKCVLLAYPSERLGEGGGAATADLLRTIDRHLPLVRAA